MKKFILPFFLIAFVTLLYNLIFKLYLDSSSLVAFLTVLVSAVSIVLTFEYFDRLYPAPSNLSMDEVKTFFTSKIFWLAALQLIIVIIEGLFKVTATEEIAKDIVELDWSNIGQALLAVAVMVIRKFDILKRLV